MVKRILITAAALRLALMPLVAYAADEETLKLIEELKNEMCDMSCFYEAKIAELEARLSQEERVTASLAPGAGHPPAKSPGGAHSRSAGNHIHGCHHGLLDINRIHLIGALDSRYVDAQDQKNMLFIHEAKLGAKAEIVEWLEGYITFTKHHGEDMELEEGYMTFIFDEVNMSAKAGKFFVNFGPENKAHFFDRRTITPSAMHEGIFGHESWADTGLQADWRVPVDFYSDISFSVLNGDNARCFGDGEDTVSNNNLPVSVNWTNGFETDMGLFNLGNSFACGEWDGDDKQHVYLAGTDAYYKYGNFDAQAELIYRYKEELLGEGENNAYGYYVFGAYNVPAEFKYLKGVEFLVSFGQFLPVTGDRETRIAPQLTFNINEYAKIRSSYEIRQEAPKDTKNNRFITQFALAF